MRRYVSKKTFLEYLSKDAHLEPVFDTILRRYAKTHKILGVGRQRVGFLSKNGVVIKVPLNPAGCSDNYWESQCYNKRWSKQERSIYAACEAFEEGGLCLLEMEYVEPCPYEPGLPDWIDFIDGCQVGRTKTGRVVAYDYGCH